jgi:DNA replication protein DnaC
LSSLHDHFFCTVYHSWDDLLLESPLEQLATEELLSRQENHLRRQMKAAGFPYAATIEQFDFAARILNSDGQW